MFSSSQSKASPNSEPPLQPKLIMMLRHVELNFPFLSWKRNTSPVGLLVGSKVFIRTFFQRQQFPLYVLVV
jgi:hypothetical protein